MHTPYTDNVDAIEIPSGYPHSHVNEVYIIGSKFA